MLNGQRISIVFKFHTHFSWSIIFINKLSFKPDKNPWHKEMTDIKFLIANLTLLTIWSVRVFVTEGCICSGIGDPCVWYLYSVSTGRRGRIHRLDTEIHWVGEDEEQSGWWSNFGPRFSVSIAGGIHISPLLLVRNSGHARLAIHSYKEIIPD